MPDIQSVRQQAAQSVEALKQLMSGLGLDDSVGVWHEFVPHASSNIQVVQTAAQAVDRLPKSDKEYFAYALTVGSGLSSIGQLEEAERFLAEARKKAPGADERAFAGYNLFGVRLRMGKYEDGLDVLMTAIRHDPKRYGLHDTTRFRPMKIVGAGGLGVFFQCENPDGGRPVLVKALWEPAAAGDGVFHDVQVLGQVPHQSILLPKEYGWSDADKTAHPYFVYERIPGLVDAQTWVQQKGPLPAEQGMAVGARILEALAVAHQAGVAHYDLKPSNVLLKAAGSELQVFLSDFGLARAGISLRQRALGNPNPEGKSPLGVKAIESIVYAAPEVLSGAGAGYHSDLYSFASTMYWLLTGQAPRETSGTALPAIPGLYQLILTCREQDPSKRPPTVAGLAQWWADPSRGPEAAGISTGLGSAPVADPLTGVVGDETGVEAPPKSKLPLILGIAAVVIVVAGLGIYFSMGGSKKEAKGAKVTGPKKPVAAITESEAKRIISWYTKARSKVYGYMSPLCQGYFEKGYQYRSFIKTIKKSRMVRGRSRSRTLFALGVEGVGSPAGKLDVFDCPTELAHLDRDHPIKIRIKVKFYQASMFSRSQRLGELRISGKLIKYKKRRYSSGVGYKGSFSLPGLRRAGEDEGIRAFGRGKPYKLTAAGLRIANLFFKRLGRGKSIDGRFEATLTTDKFKRVVADWTSGCKSGLTQALSKLEEPNSKHRKHQQYFRAAVDWSGGFCAALAKMNQSLSPYAEGGVSDATSKLIKARADWNEHIYKPIKKLVESVGMKLKAPGF